MKIKSGFVLEKVGAGYLAVAVGERAREFSGLIRLNSTGAFVFKLLSEKDMAREEVVEVMVKEYEGVSAEQITPDVDNLLKIFEDGGLLEK